MRRPELILMPSASAVGYNVRRILLSSKYGRRSCMFVRFELKEESILGGCEPPPPSRPYRCRYTPGFGRLSELSQTADFSRDC